MKRNIASITLLIIFAVTLVVGSDEARTKRWPSSAAQTVARTAQAGDAACSLARAAGNYAFSDSGTVVDIGPRAADALLTLDAEGDISSEPAGVTASLNGDVTHSTLSGTYTVNTDCTGTVNFSELDQSGNLIIATADFLWDDNMREIRFIFPSATLHTSATPPNGVPLKTVINGTARKLVP